MTYLRNLKVIGYVVMSSWMPSGLAVLAVVPAHWAFTAAFYFLDVAAVSLRKHCHCICVPLLHILLLRITYLD